MAKRTGQGRIGRGLDRFSAFMDKQGFYVLLGICLCVIIGTAVWAGRPSETPERPDTLQEGVAVDTAPDFVQQLADMQNVSGTPQPAGGELLSDLKLAWPVEGELLRGYTPDTPIYWQTLDSWGTHEGIDILAASGSMVRAARDGQVLACAEDKLWGGVVTLQHPGGLVSKYCGVGMPFLVQPGDPVTQGQAVAVIGRTAALEQAEAAHLHFELYKDGASIDPLSMLPDAGAK